MPAAARLNRLAERKRLLVLQADLHRHLIASERLRWQERVDTAREQVQTGRWWLIVGAAVAGWLLVRRLGGVARWLPAALTAARLAQSLRG
jgi:FlaA1/EpsC-like NDP-sugar epimerase